MHTRQIKTRRWRWIGRVLRMKPDSLPRAAPTWEPEGKRNRGRPRETWRRTAERERCGMGFRTWVEAETTWIPGLRSRLKEGKIYSYWSKCSRWRPEVVTSYSVSLSPVHQWRLHIGNQSFLFIFGLQQIPLIGSYYCLILIE